jgi:8-oxo-dGTP diphosphatase
MPATPKHSVSVAGVVVNSDGKVLAIQRKDNGHWEPPGGVLELDESFVDGVRREVAEETGIEVDVQALTGVYKNMTAGVVALVFLCSPKGGRRAINAEARRIEWIDVEDVPSLMDEAYAVRVIDALGGGAHARVHDGVHLLPDALTCY